MAQSGGGAGWGSLEDIDDGKDNKDKRTTTKELPRNSKNKVPGNSKKSHDMDLAPGWQEAQDPGSGRSYYFNEATGETTWEVSG